MKKTHRKWLGIIAVSAFTAISTQASPVTLSIDSSQSYLNLSGAAFGLAVTQQKPGSLVDHWGGTLSADLSGGVLTFSGGSSISALLNPSAPFSSFPNPTNWVGSLDNYGVFGSGLVNGVGLVLQLNGIYRSLVFDITTGTAQNGVAPGGMNFSLSAGQLDWGAVISPSNPVGGSSSMIGVAAVDSSATGVLFDGTTLTLPVQLHTLGSNRFEDWSGVIVATVVPEPSSLALVLAGLGLLAARARARRL